MFLKEPPVVQLFIPIQVCTLLQIARSCSRILSIEYVTPSSVRSMMRQTKGDKYRQRKEAQEETSKRKELRKREEDVLAVSKVFA